MERIHITALAEAATSPEGEQLIQSLYWGCETCRGRRQNGTEGAKGVSVAGGRLQGDQRPLKEVGWTQSPMKHSNKALTY